MSLSALIVDDEQLARDELKYLLDSVGGIDVVAQGTNGIEAVELIEEHHPDLVFLDVQMPGLDGFAVLNRLRERSEAMARAHPGEKESLPQIIFATAYDQYAVRAFDLLGPVIRSAVKAARDRLSRGRRGAIRRGVTRSAAA